MSIEHLNAAFNSDIKPSARKFVLVALADYANEDGHAYPSIETIARKTGMNPKTVRNHLAELVKMGWIYDSGERVGKTKQIPKYILRLPKTVGYQNREGYKTKATKIGRVNGTKNGSLKDYQNREAEPSVSLTTSNEPSVKEKEGLFEIPNLNIQAWEKWLEYRKRRKLRTYTTNMMAEGLAELPPDKQEECIVHSIKNEYAGLFPEKFKAKTNNSSVKSVEGDWHEYERQKKQG